MSRPFSLTLALGLSAAALAASTGAAQAQTYGAQSRYAPAQGAQSYEQCVRDQRNRQVAGAVIGGILGAVIGAELHDDAQDNARERGRGYNRGRHYRGDQRYGRGGRGYNRGSRYEQGNDGAVVGGGAVGAVAGAAIAGRGNCDQYARAGYGYGGGQAAYGQDPYRGGGQAPYRSSGQPIYDESGRAYSDSYGYSDDYAYADQYGDDYRYDQPSSGVLLGGQDYRQDTRSYSAGSTYSAGSSGPCQNMRSGNGALVLMCQGQDGIWRPA